MSATIKHLRLRVQFTVAEDSDQRLLGIEFEAESVRDWALSLCLLETGLVDMLQLADSAASFKLELRKASWLPDGIRATADWEPAQLRLTLSSTELKYWMHFFLRYYRDGYGEVDHIDVEVVPVEPAERQTYVTVKVPYAAEPVTAEEARRRLGL